MTRTSVFCVFFFVLAINCNAINTYSQKQEQQVITITGIVSDMSGPLSGVNVMVKGTTTGIMTDADGKYSLTVPDKNAIVVFSYIGYITREITVDDQTVINVAMQEDIAMIDEVVVVGYGTQRKVNLTGSISTLNEKALANRPITNSSQALQGINGIYVNQEKGRPGDDGATIRIRGVGTLNNNNPLVLVDGIEFPLKDVNPSDIESISVLKDAASAAIYGNRAANGVILIKTKTGSNNKVQIDYNGYWGMQKATFYPKVVTNAIQYMEGKNLALANEMKPPEYSQELINEYKAGTDPYIYSNTDWFDIMFCNAPMQEHNLRLYGGTDKVTYSISLGYMNQDGVMLNTWANKYSFSANINSAVTKRLNVSVAMTNTYWNYRESAITADEGSGTEGGIMGLLYRGLPMQVPVLKNGEYADQWVRVPGHNFFRNPYALSYEGYRKNNSLRNLLNISIEYTLPLDVKYKLTGAVNMLNEGEKYAWPSIELVHPKTGEIALMGNIHQRGVRNSQRTGSNLTLFQTLSWDKRYEQHEISVLGGFSLESFDNANFYASNSGYFGNELNVLNAGSTAPDVGGTETTSRLASFFGRLHYGFQDKYIVEANFRYDGSSRFASGHRWGFFPSFSGAWRISQEDFMKELTWLSNLKIRASYGKLGNQNISLFSYISAVSLGRDYSFNETVVGGTAITQIADPRVSWETTKITDIGFDLGINNKLSMEFDWFDKKTIDILRQVNISAQVGNLTGPWRNIGTVSNKGYEFSLNYRDQIGNFSYSAGGNIASIKNKVLDIRGDIIYDGVTIIQEGYPINAYYGKQVIGIFQTQAEIDAHPVQGSAGAVVGDLKYKKINMDNPAIIDNNDRTVIGNSIPQYTYGFTLGANYKGWELSLFFQGVGKVDTYVNGNLAYPYRNGAGVTTEWLTDSWTPERPNARLPRLTTGTGYPVNFETSDFWLKDASYLRLKNAQLSYNLPATWLRTVNIVRAKLFVNAQNYLTFTKFKLGDPERQVTRTNMIEYPIAKIFTMGVNVTF